MTSTVDIELLANLPKGKKPPLLSPFVKPASEPKPPKSAILIYNPAGGKKKAARLAERLVLPMLKEAGVQVETRATERQGHAGEMGRTLPLAGVDALLVMGGDGTLSELLDGFVQREDGAVSSCTLGFIPAGTGNTYVGEVLGVKTKGASDAAVRAAVQAIIDGRSRRVDCQQLDMTGLDSKPLRRISINTVMAGFGPDANAVAERRRWMGPMRYSISIKTEILKLPMRKPLPCTLAIDGAPPQPLRDLFLFGCFVNKYTGVEHRITPFAQLDDGKLDVVYTNTTISSILRAAKIDGMVKGGGKHVHEPACSLAQLRTLTLETEKPARLMVDGDIIGATPLTATVLPGAFSLFTPESPAPS